MAFDGFTTAALVSELNNKLLDGRISKIAQPEPDELLLTIKSASGNYRLLLCANASLPLVYLTEQNKPSPLTAPGFCMLLRKHIGGGHIISVEQPSLERIIVFTIEHRDEMGDLCRKKLIAEIMGKHSNIIFCDDKDMILDSIKHVSGLVSSVREVLPGRHYYITNTQDKCDPHTISFPDFCSVIRKPMPLSRAIYTSLTGFSPVMAEELCHRSRLDGGLSAESADELSLSILYEHFTRLMNIAERGDYHPVMYFDNTDAPKEFSPIPLEIYAGSAQKPFSSISFLLEDFYARKAAVSRIRQKSSDLRKVVSTLVERTARKCDLQQKQMKDTEKKDLYRLRGELLNTYGYTADPGAESLVCVNYYSNEEITIPLDPTLSAIDNAKKYFDRYAKLKRTEEALKEQLLETRETLDHLESISVSLDAARTEDDLKQIRSELAEYDFIRKKAELGKRRDKIVSRPLHYVSCDGFDIYVGKNNYQNEEISFRIADGNDWWFHAKGIPGSHVVIKNGGAEMSDEAFEECGRLAAYYSKGRNAPKVEVDYTLKRNLKKPSGARCGYVIYYTNYSLVAEPQISAIREITS